VAKYYVEFEGLGCTIVVADDRDTAHDYALKEFGRDRVKLTRLATDEEVEWNLAMRGVEHKAGS